MAAEIKDWASRTLFMASSISLLEASDFRLGDTSPAVTWFSFGSTVLISFNNWSAASDWEFRLAPGRVRAASVGSSVGAPRAASGTAPI